MSIFSFLKSNSSQQIQSLQAADFKSAIADKSVQLIDVRTPAEYAQGTIENAELMDIYSKDFEHQIDKLDNTRPVAVFCHSGARSMHAARILVQKGFPLVYNLRNGIISWR